MWAAHRSGSAADGGDDALTVTVSPLAREILASYAIDEQTMEIRILFPAAWPLRKATVEGVRRVAVDERKWRGWLATTQAVIGFSNSSVVDGLLAFRRNVETALKDHAECAICYALVGPDRRMPGKRCRTCRNLFHGACLYRWFDTSSSTTCPLCRNPFIG